VDRVKVFRIGISRGGSHRKSFEGTRAASNDKWRMKVRMSYPF
jgi:hypothetical protein